MIDPIQCVMLSLIDIYVNSWHDFVVNLKSQPGKDVFGLSLERPCFMKRRGVGSALTSGGEIHYYHPLSTSLRLRDLASR